MPKRGLAKLHEVIDLQIILKKYPKNPIIIHGFPGFGLVGTIASEFLLEHLNVEQIGKITVEEMPAMIAVHKNKVVEPFGIFYNKKYNIVIVNAIVSPQGLEWKIADYILRLAKKLQAKELIALEGLAGENPDEFKTFFYTNNQKKAEAINKLGIQPLGEGIIMGVTGALLMKADMPIICVFSETHTNLPDSKAAAKIIEELDKYLGLEVDYVPLLKQAETFEKKLQDIMKKSAMATDLSEQKRMSYVG